MKTIKTIFFNWIGSDLGFDSDPIKFKWNLCTVESSTSTRNMATWNTMFSYLLYYFFFLSSLLGGGCTQKPIIHNTYKKMSVYYLIIINYLTHKCSVYLCNLPMLLVCISASINNRIQWVKQVNCICIWNLNINFKNSKLLFLCVRFKCVQCSTTQDKQLDARQIFWRVKDATNQEDGSFLTFFLLCEMFHQQNKKQDELWLVLSSHITKSLWCNQSIMQELESAMG